MRLSKGIEVEIYTGTPQGTIVGLADRIVEDLDGFVREPDSRNVEYTTAPIVCYDRLLCALVRPRQQLRAYLKKLGDYTLIPGSTLSTGGSDRFYRSDPQNPYHDYIEQTYGTDVVTASVHINIGIADPETLIRACRLIRVEAPLFLALSAASPFLDGKVTGYHSSRWQVFPKTPQQVPLFKSHAHFIRWTEQQLDLGTMQNVRHLWSSVRPNGDCRPYQLNRLELRICDLLADPLALLAVTALLEARLLQMIADPSLDPLQQSKLSPEDLIEMTNENETLVAHRSLEAILRHWRDGRAISAADWIQELYAEVAPAAKQNQLSCYLTPVKKILREGNTAQQWLRQVESELSVQEVMMRAIAILDQQEQSLAEQICNPMVV